MDRILPLINEGIIHFGENKVQEAYTKWNNVLEKHPAVKLHMIGKLQSNKAKKALQLFSYIHSLDNIKLAQVLSKLETSIGKKINYFIQVNMENEVNKSGIAMKDLNEFHKYCSEVLNLNIIGLMAIPPDDGNHKKYFELLSKINITLGLNHLSMGMSADYGDAVDFGSTFVRIGSGIFGKRT